MGVIDRYKQLPRATRWGVLAAVGLALYFAAVEPALKAMSELESRSESAASWLEVAARQSEASSEQVRRARTGTQRFGEVLPPAGPGDKEVRERVQAFSSLLTRVLQENGVQTWQERTPRPGVITTGPLVTQINQGAAQPMVIERIVRELEFTAPPETAAAIVASFESSPEVARITDLDLRNANNTRSGESPQRAVTVSLTLETWIVTPKAGRGR